MGDEDDVWDDDYGGYDSDFVEKKEKKFDEDGNEIPPTPRLKEHICEDCSGTFRTKKELLGHKKVKHGYIPPKPERVRINCEVCWKSIDKSSLKSHMSSHNTEKSVECPE